ncbi:hypothetical protein T310_7887 [Rasamsonia emersonii CBS 393.64]|uniref:SMP domain-containing protein n=1 Tax=Rasamsonia emersonii (strain ATCC 16479 / CBS 393.64 / IMI 116815) TaxID=1408163 RepID=A0A0F4YJZ5_RASE3|nr:hypothetical protein T310_7887 [Rasamsonia emersonii CBS 393.64]KKA18171.1 hypothetical protein T310_7887 [Rasamsonia emersonii CBS 393.64]
MSLNDLPSVNEIKRAVAAGQRITSADVSAIAQAESEMTGRGPVKGGPAATAHSLASKQMNFDAKVDELASKPQSHITRKDARDIQSAESHLPSGGLQGRAFNTPPGPASISAQVRSIADRNEMLGLPAVHDPGPVWDGAEGEFGGADAGMYPITPTSAADKVENAKRGVRRGRKKERTKRKECETDEREEQREWTKRNKKPKRKEKKRSAQLDRELHILSPPMCLAKKKTP